MTRRRGRGTGEGKEEEEEWEQVTNGALMDTRMSTQLLPYPITASLQKNLFPIPLKPLLSLLPSSVNLSSPAEPLSMTLLSTTPYYLPFLTVLFPSNVLLYPHHLRACLHLTPTPSLPSLPLPTVASPVLSGCFRACGHPVFSELHVVVVVVVCSMMPR